MTTVVLRPNATDYIDGAFALTGGATAHAVLSDNSDGSYGNAAASLDPAYMAQLTTVSLPAGAVTKTLTPRVRYNTTGGVYCQHWLGIYAGLTALVYATFSSLAAAATTFTGASLAWTGSQADIDGLHIAGSIFVDAYLGASSRLHEVYVDLVYATVPTVAVSLPTGAVTTTTTPTVVHAYTAGSDGDVQSRSQYRVFTAAQYGIGGFDPAVSPNTVDSGILVTAATAWVTPSLANGTTFKVYVRAAQTINGVPHWGVWTSGPAFNIAVTTSDITSIVGTADNVNGRIALLVTRNGATPAWQTLEVQRTDDAGVTWSAIRGTNGLAGVAVSGATWPLNDYESANAATVTYRARASYVTGGQTITGAWVASASVAWTMPVDWLKDCRNTARNRQVNMRVNPTLNRARPQGVLTVIGRADPVTVSDVRHLTSGVLELVTFGDVAANDLLALTTSDVLLLQTRPGNRFGSKYIAIGDVTETAIVGEVGTEPNRFWSVPFVEVLKPIDVGIV